MYSAWTKWIAELYRIEAEAKENSLGLKSKPFFRLSDMQIVGQILLSELFLWFTF